jgi:cytochrome c
MKNTVKFVIAAGSIIVLAGTAAHADGHIKKGEKVFRKCKACHMVGPKAKKRVGPVLNDVLDRKAGTVEGFKYSKAMIAKGEEGLVWTEENIDKYLTQPKKFIPKNKMAFPGLKKAEDRANVIAYLKQFTKAE